MVFPQKYAAWLDGGRTWMYLVYAIYFKVYTLYRATFPLVELG